MSSTSTSTSSSEDDTPEKNLEPYPTLAPPIITVGDRPPYRVFYDQPLSKQNVTTDPSDHASIATLFTLVSPATARQPLFTAVNVYVEAGRTKFWFDFFRYPIVISPFGADAPKTLQQLDNPIPAIEVTRTSMIMAPQENIAVDEAVMALSTIWGATRTTTFSTSVTAAPGDTIFLRFPTLTMSSPLEYTTLPAPSNPSSKDYPNGLPVLVLTQVDGVIINPDGTTLTTVIIVQAAPQAATSDVDGDGDKLNLVSPSYGWSTWSSAERGGVTAAAVFAALVVIALLVYLCTLRHRRETPDEERGRERPSEMLRLLSGWIPGGDTRKSSRKRREKGKERDSHARDSREAKAKHRGMEMRDRSRRSQTREEDVAGINELASGDRERSKRDDEAAGELRDPALK
ncbi:MAG: hypothetical protein M1838_003445 [Thelocarpon superellum]|nr:MAG: hypothetical protein M1838_003445 [Thelocarpon superellum]